MPHKKRLRSLACDETELSDGGDKATTTASKCFFFQGSRDVSPGLRCAGCRFAHAEAAVYRFARAGTATSAEGLIVRIGALLALGTWASAPPCSSCPGLLSSWLCPLVRTGVVLAWLCPVQDTESESIDKETARSSWLPESTPLKLPQALLPIQPCCAAGATSPPVRHSQRACLPPPRQSTPLSQPGDAAN